MRKLELLAPARNAAIGKIAIDHGADAVYIGADHFGARASAGNSVDDIAGLCRYAHFFGAKVYVTVNTIIYDKELEASRKLVEALADAGADALLVQDMAVLSMPHRIPLHASTQCDTRTADKVKWLRDLGFARAVLARELSLSEIGAIHEAVPDIELEAFIHGALCVSYSGVCYASQACFGRSANRGECAQFCRMKFDLLDADGREIVRQSHLLSLKDMCLHGHLGELADAGVCSFKIEGRLKDADYVKNVVAAYNAELNSLVKQRPADYCRASHGEVWTTFEPNLHKTFNRGYTTYFLEGRQPGIFSPDTPKALGEFVGKVKELRRDSFNVAGTSSFANGDGLCFINDSHQLEGFRVNKAVGNRLFPLRMPAHLRPGMALYRSSDEAFSRCLAGETASRRLPINFSLKPISEGFCLRGESCGRIAEATVEIAHEKAQRPQHDNIVRQLGRLGNTHFELDRCDADVASGYFIPSSMLADLRRKVVDSLAEALSTQSTPVMPQPALASTTPVKRWQREYGSFPYLYNIANSAARAFYQLHGMGKTSAAFEIVQPTGEKLIMQCRHCLRFALGYCVKHGGRKPYWKEPLMLRLGNGQMFRLEFNCAECQMNIYADGTPRHRNAPISPKDE